jgi:hypothetical protein
MSAWIVSKNHIDHLVAGAVRLGIVHPQDVTVVGRMLTNANKKSIRARYGYDDEGAARVKTYWYQRPYALLSDVSLLKQAACYDYQSCEYDGYENGPAHKFIVKLERTLEALGVTRQSEGYEHAPWGV